MTTKIRTPGITDSNVTNVKLDLIATSSTPAVTLKGDGTTDAYLKLNCSQNTHGVKIKSPPHSAAQSYTLTLPESITNGFYLQTDGSGNLSFTEVVTPSGGPTITSFTPNTVAGGVNENIVITGTNFSTTPVVEFQTAAGAISFAASVTFNSSTQITIATGTGLVNGTNVRILITNPNGQAVRSGTELTVSANPAWQTASGSLGTVAGQFSGTVATVSATGDATIEYTEVTSAGNVLTGSASGQANCSLGLTSGVISTTSFAGTATVGETFQFTLRATDGDGQTSDRDFTLTSSFGATGGGQFN
jgi:hypothetical protein|tara:strand:+ start:153 stop:1064 length:912 start_codon:yes stop_codon:yes gene_type:complete